MRIAREMLSGRPLAVLAGACMLAACSVTAERTQLMTCGGCTFWKDAHSSLLPNLSRNGTCETSCSGRLDLSNKGIAVVANGTFTGLGSITDLSLYGNQITALATNTFAGLGSVMYLDLSGNQINALAAGTFTGLGSVTHLTLDGNQITALANSTFAGLGSITGLSLRDNKINALAVGTFTGLGSVQYLSLSGNQITTLAPNTFAGLGSVTEIMLDGNQITYLAPNAFTGLGSVMTLNLSSNQIKVLAPQTFARLESVQSLYLDNNQITSLTNSSFASLPKLQDLYLANSPGVPFACPTVSRYSSGCKVNRVQICGGCTFWTHYVASSIGYSLSKTGSCETSCNYLYLNNIGITVVANGTFATLGNVQYLVLSHNQITSLVNITFADLPNLQYLNLEYNPGAPFVCPSVSEYSVGCERNMLINCGGCTFWLDGFSLVLSKTGNCETSCTSLWLSGNKLAAVANGTFDDVDSLQDLVLWGTSLGCVPGVAISVVIDSYWTTPTPRCPSNCTVNTYYMPSEGICRDCPGSSYTLGIGSKNCISPLTTSNSAPSPILTMSNPCSENNYYDQGVCWSCPAKFPASPGGSYGLFSCFNPCTQDYLHKQYLAHIQEMHVHGDSCSWKFSAFAHRFSDQWGCRYMADSKYFCAKQAR